MNITNVCIANAVKQTNAFNPLSELYTRANSGSSIDKRNYDDHHWSWFGRQISNRAAVRIGYGDKLDNLHLLPMPLLTNESMHLDLWILN